MVKGVSLFKIPSFLKRGKGSCAKKTSGEADTMDSLPHGDSAASCTTHGRSHQRSRTISGGSNVSCNEEVPRKKNLRIRTISGSSGYSTQSESNTPGQRRRRVRTISGGSNFSGDSIVTHLDQLSQRDQLLFQAYRFGGR